MTGLEHITPHMLTYITITMMCQGYMIIKVGNKEVHVLDLCSDISPCEIIAATSVINNGVAARPD